jgi:hypothetical protein
MDTQWYAVDRDGRVGSFYSGEAGAVPSAAAGLDIDLTPYLLRLRQPQEALLDLEGYNFPEDPAWHFTHWGQGPSDSHSILMFLKSLDPVQAEVAAGQARPLPCRPGAAAVFFRELPGVLARRLHDAGDCLGCFFHYLPDEEDMNGPGAAQLGLYHYSHLCENWSSGPYGRREVPAQQLHIDQLPPAIRQPLLRVRFDQLSFAETPHLQPVKFMPCDSWEHDWTDLDGKRYDMHSGQLLSENEEESAAEEGGNADGEISS